MLLDLNLPGETGWDFLRGPSLALAGNPPVVLATRDHRQPPPAGRVRGRRLPAQAVRNGDARGDRRAFRGCPPMNDILMIGILLVAFAALFGLIWLCQAVRG